MSARRVVGVLLTLALLAYLATGWTNIAPGEAGVVRRFGKVVSPSWGPGAHWGLPYGFDVVDRVRTDEVRRLDVGVSGAFDPRFEPGSGEFLTGDLNVLRASATVQYRVADPAAYALRTEGVEPLLKRLAEASLSEALASSGIDASLGDGRAAVAATSARILENEARHYGLGIAVLGVSLTDARPPSEVAADFAAAQSARSDYDRRLNEAKTYAATTLTKAESLAAANLQQAHARAERITSIARAKASKFLALLQESHKARGLTVRRIYLDAIGEMLPRVRRKLVLTPDEPVDLSIFGSP